MYIVKDPRLPVAVAVVWKASARPSAFESPQASIFLFPNKANSLQTGEKIEFFCGVRRYVALGAKLW